MRRTEPGLASRAARSHPWGRGVGHLFEVKHGASPIDLEREPLGPRVSFLCGHLYNLVV